MKKIIAGLLSIIMVFAVAVGFAGCNQNGKLDGKTFALTDVTIVIVKEFEEDGKTIKETESLNFRQFIERLWRTENDIEKDAVLTDEQLLEFETKYTRVYRNSIKSEANAATRENGVQRIISFDSGSFVMKQYDIDYSGFKESQYRILGDYTLSRGVLTLNAYTDSIIEKIELVYTGTYKDSTITLGVPGEHFDIDLDGEFEGSSLDGIEFHLLYFVYTLV